MKRLHRYFIAGIMLVFALCVTGCGGVSHKSPEKVTEALIQAYVDGKESKVKDCYAQKESTEETLQAEITATLAYFQAHDAKSVKIEDCEILSKTDNTAYVYITYSIVLNDEQEYPCVGTYMVGKEDKDYYILAPSKITDEMRSQAASDYSKFMTTDTYQKYTKEYDTFIKKNPGYEEKIAEKVN